MMGSNPYQTYEDAARDYLAKCCGLMETPHRAADANTSDAADFPPEALILRGQEIAGASAGIIQFAQEYLDSADPIIREGIRYHFIAQAAVELLIGVEILRRSEEKAGISSTAANRATYSAALREAVSAACKALSVPVTQGFSTTASYRISESATIGDAASGLKAAIESAATNILHRVQGLGADIACDLISGTQWDEVIQGASLSEEEIDAILESIHKGAAGTILGCVYRKVSALLPRAVAEAFRVKTRKWLTDNRQADQIGVFNALVNSHYNLDAFRKVVSALECSTAKLESVNKASDLVKALSDKFIVIIDRIRKLEDAIRLAKLIDIAQFRLVTIALQVSLLSALVHAGKEYIEKDLVGIIRALG
jgi:hypothetical protein